MTSVFSEKKNCAGCTACYSVCPKHCISMQYDNEGFLYPKIDTSACISCGSCKRVCPVLHSYRQPKVLTDKAFIFRTSNYDTWKRSSSGGAFTEICKAFSESGTIIFGAAFEGLTVRHIAVNGIDEIDCLRKSKYVASDIRDIFPKVKEFLKRNKKVIFSGTPCQIAGLKSFLKADYNNLLTIDLVCHGVGSPMVFQDCIKVLEHDFGKRISQYTFRAKRYFYERDYLTKINFADGDECWLMNDRYIQLFLSQACTRPSCGDNCVFNKRPRESDLTIADFKCLFRDYPQLRADRRNCSTIISHTEKGERLIKRLAQSVILLDCPIEYVIQYNPVYCEHTHKSGNANRFFNDYVLNHENAIYKWTKPSEKASISVKMILSKCVPISWKVFVSDLKKGRNE